MNNSNCVLFYLFQFTVILIILYCDYIIIYNIIIIYIIIIIHIILVILYCDYHPRFNFVIINKLSL